MNLPKAKTDNIVVQELGNELLIYNLTTHKAYTLNETSKIVFESCDGATSFDELKRRYKFTDDLIYLALDELKANDLLIGYQTKHFKGLSRREVVKKVGLASLITLPVITAIAAPSAANAASSTCSTQRNGIDSQNGARAKGELCLCRVGATGNLRPCDTTRGGDGSDPELGCQTSCLCQYNGTPCGGADEVCVGTCG